MSIEEIIKKEIEVVDKLDTTNITFGKHMGYLLENKERIRKLYRCILKDILNYIDYVEGKNE